MGNLSLPILVSYMSICFYIPSKVGDPYVVLAQKCMQSRSCCTEYSVVSFEPHAHTCAIQLLWLSSSQVSIVMPVVRRYKQGRPLSVLDGVPYAVIDGIDALPYPTTAGTSFVRPCSPSASAEDGCNWRSAWKALVGWDAHA